MTASYAARALGGAFLVPLLFACAGAGVPALPGECVAALRNVRAGSGAKTFASAYAFAGGYAYGEWAAGVARGQSLWRKAAQGWCKVQTGTDVLDERALEGYGVPAAQARRLLAQMASGPQIAPPQVPKGGNHR